MFQRENRKISLERKDRHLLKKCSDWEEYLEQPNIYIYIKAKVDWSKQEKERMKEEPLKE